MNLNVSEPPEEPDKMDDGTRPDRDGAAGENGINNRPAGALDIRYELLDWAQALVTSLIFVILLFTFIARIITVDGISMNPTLQNQDKVLLTNLFYTPKSGDIVVFTKKGLRLAGFGDKDQPLVKRVIATQGQTVDINFETAEVFVNGVLQDEPFINEPTHRQLDLLFPVVVPDGCVFVMGDNRNESTDSRDSRIGMIDTRYILGHVLIRVFPFDALGKVG